MKPESKGFDFFPFPFFLWLRAGACGGPWWVGQRIILDHSSILCLEAGLSQTQSSMRWMSPCSGEFPVSTFQGWNYVSRHMCSHHLYNDEYSNSGLPISMATTFAIVPTPTLCSIFLMEYKAFVFLLS